MTKTIVAIIGTYRKGCTTDQAIDAVLSADGLSNTKIKKIYLSDHHIEFCKNCRACTQVSGEKRGICIYKNKDDMSEILDEIEKADALVLASPINFYNVTALMRRFMERLIVYSYWPWGSQRGPTMRRKKLNKKAIIITSAGMPGFLIPLFTGATRALYTTAKVLGAKPVGRLLIGLSCVDEKQALSSKIISKAQKLGGLLV